VGCYKPEQKAFWREVVRTALNAADATPSDNGKMEKRPPVSPAEVEKFRDHCVYIRAVFTFLVRIWRDSNAGERKTLENIAPSFFSDIGTVLGEWVVIAACRVTDEHDAGRGRENFTVELFANSFPTDSPTYKKLHELRGRMGKLRTTILPARHKLGAHADRDVIRKGEVLAGGTFPEWEEFWKALAEFVSVLNEQTFGSAFEIDAAGTMGDAECLIKYLTQGQHFDSLINGSEPVIRDACLKLVLPPELQ
jgi:hypothetical protein